MSVEVPPVPKRVLAIGAHPDDLEFMAGGTIAAWAAAGAHIAYCLVTDGTAGSRDPAMTHERLAALRQAEQRAAAAVLGVQEVYFLGYRDGRLEPTLDVRLAIARIIRQVRPDAVITTDPSARWSKNYINHPDHVAAAEAALAAIMPTANTLLAAPELLAEGHEPHDVGEVFLVTFRDADTYIPLTEFDVERKVAALREHHTQLDDWDAAPMVREWAERTAEQARQHDLDCAYAEGFYRIILRRPEPSADETATEPASQASV